MTTLAATRDALQALLDDISGLRVYDTWPDTFNPPGLIIKPVAGDSRETFADHGSFAFELILCLQIGNYRASQIDLDAYLSHTGARSITTKLRSDPYLAATVEYAMAGQWRDYGGIEINGVEYLGAKLDLTVYVVN